MVPLKVLLCLSSFAHEFHSLLRDKEQKRTKDSHGMAAIVDFVWVDARIETPETKKSVACALNDAKTIRNWFAARHVDQVVYGVLNVMLNMNEMSVEQSGGRKGETSAEWRPASGRSCAGDGIQGEIKFIIIFDESE